MKTKLVKIRTEPLLWIKTLKEMRREDKVFAPKSLCRTGVFIMIRGIFSTYNNRCKSAVHIGQQLSANVEMSG